MRLSNRDVPTSTTEKFANHMLYLKPQNKFKFFWHSAIFPQINNTQCRLSVIYEQHPEASVGIQHPDGENSVWSENLIS